MERLVIIGNSPLSYFLAQELDKRLGGLVHLKIDWLTADPAVAHLASAESLSGHHYQLGKPEFNHLRLRRSSIASVNLRTRQVVTESGVIDFDQLIIDQIPTYSPGQIAAIRQQLVTFWHHLQGRTRTERKPVHGRVYCQGQSIEAWQLGLLIARELRRHHPGLVSSTKVLADLPGNHIGDFLRRSGLYSATVASLKLPGLTIKAPASALPNRKIRGLRLGRDDRAITAAGFVLADWPNVTILDDPALEKINLLRVWRSLARRLAASIESRLEAPTSGSLELSSPALLLTGHDSRYLLLGDVESRRVRARLVAGLETRLKHGR